MRARSRRGAAALARRCGVTLVNTLHSTGIVLSEHHQECTHRMQGALRAAELGSATVSVTACTQKDACTCLLLPLCADCTAFVNGRFADARGGSVLQVTLAHVCSTYWHTGTYRTVTSPEHTVVHTR